MFRRTLAVMLSGIILLTALAFQQVIGQTGADTKAVEKVRASVQKIGVGPSARVDVKLQDRTTLKGYVSSADQDSFTVTDKAGSTKTVTYSEASSVKKAGSGLSAKSWIIIGAAVVGAAITWVIIKPALCDGGAGTRGPC